MNPAPKSELIRLESNTISNSVVDKGQGAYFVVPCKNKEVPMWLSLVHEDSAGFGVEIYWSRKTKYPYKEDSEGKFHAPICARNTFCPVSFSIQTYGETKFTCDSIYLGVYQYSMATCKVSLVASFCHNTSKQALLDFKSQEETRQLQEIEKA